MIETRAQAVTLSWPAWKQIDDHSSGNTNGSNNTAIDLRPLFFNSTGSENTAIGVSTLTYNDNDGQTSGYGSQNTAVGARALLNGGGGSNNIALGYSAGSSLVQAVNNIDIGNVGTSFDINTIRIGDVQTATYIAGISGALVPTGVAVLVDSSGHLGTTTSSVRFKDEIKQMDKASEAILALQPVTFRYKHELDPEGIPQFGLVAEDVEKVNHDLVARDKQGKPYSVRYEAVNAMLLNEFLKEHRTMEELKKEIAALTATVKEQAAQIQKVSAELEASRAAPQIVLNNQ